MIKWYIYNRQTKRAFNLNFPEPCAAVDINLTAVLEVSHTVSAAGSDLLRLVPRRFYGNKYIKRTNLNDAPE